jgi:hypothetical protein
MLFDAVQEKEKGEKKIARESQKIFLAGKYTYLQCRYTEKNYK